MKDLMTKVITAIAMVLFIAPVAVGTVHTAVAEKEAGELVTSIEEVIVENKDNATVIEDSKYRDDMHENQFYVQSAIRENNAAPIATIDHVNDNGEEFTNEVYLTEHNGEYGLLIIQNAEKNAIEYDYGLILINYNTDINVLAQYAAYYGYGCIEAI